MNRTTILALSLCLALSGCTSLPDVHFGLWQTDTGEIISLRESGDDGIRLRFFGTGETRRFTRSDGDAWIAGHGISEDRLNGARLQFDGGEFMLETESHRFSALPLSLPTRITRIDSGGTYGHNFYELFDDFVAVVDWLATQPEIDLSRIGVSGYSQGGWIGPLAATKSPEESLATATSGSRSDG